MTNPFTKYIVTDPCYIIDDSEWNDLCKQADTLSNGDEKLWTAELNQLVTKCLQAKTSPIAKACNTGFGDWVNKITGIRVLQPKFYADSGMVCVCPLTESLDAYIKDKYGKNYLLFCTGIAAFEASDDITVTFDTSDKAWTVVKVLDNKYNIRYTSQETNSSDEDDDEDDENYYEDEYDYYRDNLE